MRCLTVGLMMAAMGNGVLGNGAENVPAEADGETNAVAAVSRRSHAANRWRYVWHNDRWWYWAAGERWSYFDGRRWNTYDPRRTAAVASRYRKAAAFERPPAAPPRPPVSEPADLGRLDAKTDARTGVLPAPHSRDGLSAFPSNSLFGERVPVSGDGLGDASRNRDRRGTSRAGGKNGGKEGGGAFGGPTGGSFGAGSAAGAASTPQ